MGLLPGIEKKNEQSYLYESEKRSTWANNPLQKKDLTYVFK